MPAGESLRQGCVVSWLTGLALPIVSWLTGKATPIESCLTAMVLLTALVSA